MARLGDRRREISVGISDKIYVYTYRKCTKILDIIESPALNIKR